MALRYVFLLGLLGCEEAPDQRQSRPVNAQRPATTSAITIPVGTEAQKPTSSKALRRRLPALDLLTQPQMQAVVAALNLVPSPCSMCDTKTAAHCLVDLGLTECGVLTKLSDRAIRLAKEGRDADHIKVAINYPDLWFSEMGRGVPVQIHLYRDLDGRFAVETEAIRAGVLDIFGDQIQIVTHDDLKENVGRLDVRSRPTWFVNGHRFRGLQSINSIARFVSRELDD